MEGLDKIRYDPPKLCPFCGGKEFIKDPKTKEPGYYQCPCGTGFYLKKTSVGLSWEARFQLHKAAAQTIDDLEECRGRK